MSEPGAESCPELLPDHCSLSVVQGAVVPQVPGHHAEQFRFSYLYVSTQSGWHSYFKTIHMPNALCAVETA